MSIDEKAALSCLSVNKDKYHSILKHGVDWLLRNYQNILTLIASDFVADITKVLVFPLALCVPLNYPIKSNITAKARHILSQMAFQSFCFGDEFYWPLKFKYNRCTLEN